MNIVTLKLSDLTAPEKNVRIHTEKQLREYEKSVRMFGQIRPIVIDENNTILAGRGLYDTLLRMGKETAECYQYMDLTENQKKKLMIADNKIFSLGIENLDTLNEFLEDLQGDLDIPGFDEEILKQMVAGADEVTEKLAEYGTLDDDEIQNIQAANEKREQKAASTVEQSHPLPTPAYAPSDNVAPPQYVTPPDAQGPTGPAADVQKFVICPNCGEKIWL